MLRISQTEATLTDLIAGASGPRGGRKRALVSPGGPASAQEDH